MQLPGWKEGKYILMNGKNDSPVDISKHISYIPLLLTNPIYRNLEPTRLFFRIRASKFF